MDMQADNRSAGSRDLRVELARLLGGCRPMVEQWCLQAGTDRWGISAVQFTSELARCAEARFRGGPLVVGELQTYLSTLHLADLALACACADGVAEAWEYFVPTYRGYLRACAGAMLKRSASSPEAQELADSLFGELYGLTTGKRGSLLRYFHGRSTLKTWLRAVLAQRHVDQIRAGRKFEELGDEDGNDGVALRGAMATVSPAAADPHRARYLAMLTSALQTALKNLDGPDAERLRMYYAEQKKLAEIGRVLGEHESSVSRHLERVRRDLRHAVEEILRGGGTGGGSVAANGEAKASGLSDAEIALCFEYATEDAPINLDTLFAQPGAPDTGYDAKDISKDI
jgi:RNA polymerase sigma factor (sigma-70 family)